MFLPWWATALFLALMPLAHYLWTRRMLAVSGRITSLVDQLRERPAPAQAELTPEEMLAALQDATAAEFGEDQLAAALAEADPAAGHEGETASAPPGAPPLRAIDHGAFFGGLVLGGFLAAVLRGGFQLRWALGGLHFTRLFGQGVGAWLALLSGGVLVGFGTRMAGGCSTGHGLCGVSRLQPGSLLSMACFFAAAAAVWLGLNMLRGG